jgi:membrane-associated phospholipid phosphatase
MAVTLIVDAHRFLVSSLVLIGALLVAQTRVEAGIHSALEVFYGALLGSITALAVIQVLG